MILWINLVTNGLPALALGVDPPDARLMEEAPRPPNEGLLGRRDYLGILYVGVCMGAAAISFYVEGGASELGELQARALAFSLLALSPLFHAWNSRSPTRSLFSAKPLVSMPLVIACAASAAIHLVALLVPGLRPVFRTYALTGAEWARLLLLSALIIPAVEFAKAIQRVVARSAQTSPPASRA
jgi:Ca2+-transporting ATPase